MIVVGGEALVDLVPARPDDRDPWAALVPRPGGGPFNTAVALGRLGVPVALLSRLSTDPFGSALADVLGAAGVDPRWVQRGPEPTALAVLTVAADGGADYAFHLDGTADRLVTDPGPLPGPVTAVALGTLSLAVQPCAAVYEAVLRREAARGVLTVLDPNIRPGVIADPDDYRSRFTAWLPHLGVLKLAEPDARWLLNAPDADAAALDRAARSWLRAGVGAVVLTRGAAGLSAFTEAAGRVDVPAAPARVVDTVGAGDTVHAALLAWLDAHGRHSAAAVRAMGEADWRAALRLAARAAAVTVGRAGAQPPSVAELYGPKPAGSGDRV